MYPFRLSIILYQLLKSTYKIDFTLTLDEEQAYSWHRFGTTYNFFTVAKFQKGLPDFSESPIKSSFLLIIQ